VLREKELHIEQLLKERDLERAEVTRAASQADDAEQKLAAYKQEFEQVCLIVSASICYSCMFEGVVEGLWFT
jgi:hypothetical protein